jgi:hypothetical protein
MGIVGLAVVAGVSMAAARFVDCDPTGRYELATTMRGRATSLVAVIKKLDDGSYGGDLSGSGINSVKILEVRCSDSTVKFAVNASEEVRANFTIVVRGDSVSGSWSMAGEDGGPLAGHKR